MNNVWAGPRRRQAAGQATRAGRARLYLSHMQWSESRSGGPRIRAGVVRELESPMSGHSSRTGGSGTVSGAALAGFGAVARAPGAVRLVGGVLQRTRHSVLHSAQSGSVEQGSSGSPESETSESSAEQHGVGAGAQQDSAGAGVQQPDVSAGEPDDRQHAQLDGPAQIEKIG
jgi:hypothetical protein